VGVDQRGKRDPWITGPHGGPHISGRATWSGKKGENQLKSKRQPPMPRSDAGSWACPAAGEGSGVNSVKTEGQPPGGEGRARRKILRRTVQSGTINNTWWGGAMQQGGTSTTQCSRPPETSPTLHSEQTPTTLVSGWGQPRLVNTRTFEPTKKGPRHKPGASARGTPNGPTQGLVCLPQNTSTDQNAPGRDGRGPDRKPF